MYVTDVSHEQVAEQLEDMRAERRARLAKELQFLNSYKADLVYVRVSICMHARAHTGTLSLSLSLFLSLSLSLSQEHTRGDEHSVVIVLLLAILPLGFQLSTAR